MAGSRRPQRGQSENATTSQTASGEDNIPGPRIEEVDELVGDVDAAIAIAEREREDLLKKRKLKNIQNEVEILRRHEAQVERPRDEPNADNNGDANPPASNVDPQDDARPHGEKRGQRESWTTGVQKRTTRPIALKEYWGKTVREHTEWTRDTDCHGSRLTLLTTP